MKISVRRDRPAALMLEVKMLPLFVKVDPTIGREGLWKVLSTDGPHYFLKHVVTDERMQLYIGHTRQDMETQRAGFEARKARADTLGNRLKRRKL